MKIIDTHTHFHDPATTDDLVWPKRGDPYYRTCVPDTYRAEVGIRPVIAVETSPRRKDDLRLMQQAARDPLILGYISNLQPLQAGFEHRLAEAVSDAKWRGIRLRPIALFDLNAVSLIAALDRLDGQGHVELGITHPDRLGALRGLCLTLPHIRFVVTHCGHPSLGDATAPYEYTQLAGLENLYVKLSPPQGRDMKNTVLQSRLARHVVALLNCLSAQRLMFGSNWPVTLQPMYFERWLADTLSAAGGDVRQVFEQTASDLYRQSVR